VSEKPKLEVVTPKIVPADALDMDNLWLDPQLGDGITDTHWHSVPVDKPKDFFRVHPDQNYRRRTEIYTHKPEGAIEVQHYIVHPKMHRRGPPGHGCRLYLSRWHSATMAAQVCQAGREG
jgi:hypothetical protein